MGNLYLLTAERRSGAGPGTSAIPANALE